MKTKFSQFLIMGALAIGITSNAMAAEDKQLCFQINGDINNSTQIAKAILTVNSAGVATGTECFYSITDKSATPSCSPVIGNVNGKYPQAFLSLTGNWQRNIGPDVVPEDTNVSVHYNFKKLSGEGIAKTFKTIGTAPPQEVNSSEGGVSRIACPKPLSNFLSQLPSRINTQTTKPARLGNYQTQSSATTPTCSKPPVIVGNLEVQSCDYVNSTGKTHFIWKDAVAVAKTYGPGWVLPTKTWLDVLALNKDVVGGFASGFYWSSTEQCCGSAWAQNMGTEQQGHFVLHKNPKYRVRAVRPI